MLAAVKKKWQDANLDISTIMRNPTLRGFAAEIDRYQLYVPNERLRLTISDH